MCAVQRGASPRPIDDPIYFDDNGEYAWVRIADVSKSKKYLKNTLQRLSTFGRAKSVTLEPGAIFLSIAASVGKPIITKIKCCIHDGFVYFLGLREDPEYLFYVFSCGEIFVGLGKFGTQLNLNTEIIGGIFLGIPPLHEQRAIATFLDRETARIDALVEKKERLIELLQEKRAGLITNAVTRGLDPNVPTRDSGVEWVGEIPAHWEVKRLTTVIKFQRGHDLPSDNREEGEVPVVTSSGISSMHSRAVASAPGIVTGRCGTIGQFYLINRSYWPHNTALYSIDLHGNEPRFLQYMLVHLAPLFYLHSIKSAVPAVDRNDVHAEHTAVPPVSEQHAIADFLDRETSNLDALVTKIKGAIDCLKELRAALISSAVTGKIDVRSLVSIDPAPKPISKIG